MDQYILALDQGTTSSRAILFDRAATIKAMSQQEFPQHFVRPGWVEHDPMEIWESQLEVARQVLRQSGVQASQIAAIGIANQRETTVVWDIRSGEPIYPAIVWQDRRTASLCEELRASGLSSLFEERTGLVIDPYFSGTKLAWLLEHVPGARERAERNELAFGTVDSWLAWKLTGRHVTDPSNASRTLLFDISKMEWDLELLGLLKIPPGLLPEVVDTSGIFGMAHADCLGASVPVASLVGDQQAACFGQMCLRPGMAKNTYGTGCFLLLNAGSQPARRDRLLSSVGWAYRRQEEWEPTYVLEGAVFSAGAAVQWLRDGLGLISTSAEVEPLARSVTDNGGVTLVPAFAGLGAPYWDAQVRGSILGLTRGTRPGHIARAALESIACQVSELLAEMKSGTGQSLLELRVDGGAARNDFLMQLQADMIGIPVVRPLVTETTALGAAYLAGLAVNYWENEEEIRSLWRLDRRFDPTVSEGCRASILDTWKLAVRATREFRPPTSEKV